MSGAREKAPTPLKTPPYPLTSLREKDPPLPKAKSLGANAPPPL